MTSSFMDPAPVSVARTRLGLLPASDRAGELFLVQRRRARDAQLLGARTELAFRVAVVVDAAETLAASFAGGSARLLGARIRWPLVVFRLPVVAAFLERMLQRRVRGAMCALAVAVLLRGRVVH